jgi:hypothetical protein
MQACSGTWMFSISEAQAQLLRAGSSQQELELQRSTHLIDAPAFYQLLQYIQMNMLDIRYVSRIDSS